MTNKRDFSTEELASITVPLPLRKGAVFGTSVTDWSQAAMEYAPTAPQGVHTSYNLSETRPNGNVFFKRYPDGSLDLEDAKNRVYDCLVKAKNLVELTDLEKLVLQIHFPGNFQFMDAVVADQMRRVNIKLSEEEKMIISAMVASHVSYAHERAAFASGS